MLYALVITVLNFRSINRILHYHPDVINLLVKPVIASAVMGIVCFGCYRLLHMVLGTAIPMVISIIVAVAVYFAAAVKIGLLTEAAMKDFPKGGSLIRLARKLKLM